MAYVGMECIVMANIRTVCMGMACMGMAYTGMAYIVMACILTACIVIACIVMAYIVMAYIVMANVSGGGSATTAGLGLDARGMPFPGEYYAYLDQ